MMTNATNDHQCVYHVDHMARRYDLSRLSYDRHQVVFNVTSRPTVSDVVEPQAATGSIDFNFDFISYSHFFSSHFHLLFFLHSPTIMWSK